MDKKFSPLYCLLSFLNALFGSKKRFADITIVSGQSQKIYLKAEVADSWIKRALGLMGREGLAGDEGMLFVFDREGRLKFWMRDILLPLDIIFISEDRRVVDMVENAEPCDRYWCRGYRSGVLARYALEVGAGFVEKHGIGKGDRVEIGLIY